MTDKLFLLFCFALFITVVGADTVRTLWITRSTRRDTLEALGVAAVIAGFGMYVMLRIAGVL